MMADRLELFRERFLHANSWDLRKDGAPLDLLDNLSPETLQIVEQELIDAMSLRDDWLFRGLGHIKSVKALPAMYEWLEKSKQAMKVTIAHAIFQISCDE